MKVFHLFLFLFLYSSAYCQNLELHINKKTGKYGFAGTVCKKQCKDKVLIKEKFDYAEPFVDGIALAAIKNKEDVLKFGYIDIEGKWLHPPILNWATSLSDNNLGMAMIMYGNTLALIKKIDIQSTPNNFDVILNKPGSKFEHLLSIFTINSSSFAGRDKNGWGFLKIKDDKLYWADDIRYDSIQLVKGHPLPLRAKKGNKWHFIDEKSLKLYNGLDNDIGFIWIGEFIEGAFMVKYADMKNLETRMNTPSNEWAASEQIVLHKSKMEQIRNNKVINTFEGYTPGKLKLNDVKSTGENLYKVIKFHQWGGINYEKDDILRFSTTNTLYLYLKSGLQKNFSNKLTYTKKEIINNNNLDYFWWQKKSRKLINLPFGSLVYDEYVKKERTNAETASEAYHNAINKAYSMIKRQQNKAKTKQFLKEFTEKNFVSKTPNSTNPYIESWHKKSNYYTKPYTWSPPSNYNAERDFRDYTRQKNDEWSKRK